jgi:hypothetical protein
VVFLISAIAIAGSDRIMAGTARSQDRDSH